MELQLSPAKQAFREQVRKFFQTHLPREIQHKVCIATRLEKSELRRWHEILDDHGYAVPGWPLEWGGKDWDQVDRYIFFEELQLAGAPMPHGQTVNLAGPVIFTFGTEAQKQYFLPRMRRLEILFCQGFSEPNAGSDLASLRLAAKRDGDAYIVNGQKIWTTDAHEAEWGFVLVRTDSSGRKQDGITYLLIDMNSPGITVRPIYTIDHRHHTNEVFFDNVRVPVANRIGEEGRGWEYAKFLLGYERAGTVRAALPKARLALAKELAQYIPRPAAHGGGVLADDPQFIERVTLLEVETKALEVTNLRVISSDRRSNQPDPKTSILKLAGTRLQQATSELLFDMAGPSALVLTELEDASLGPLDAAAQSYFYDRAASIFGGSMEIQHNILAKRVLDL